VIDESAALQAPGCKQMSKPFLGFALLFSIFILWLNMTAKETNPAIILLWVVIGGASAYKLFKRSSRAS
jgi:hypothetical protein